MAILIMPVIVIYDSAFGNTEQIARAITGGLATSGEVQISRVGDIKPSGLAGAKLVVIGSPTQGGRPTPAMRDFLDGIPRDALQGVRVAVFDTRLSTKLVGVFGYAAGRIAGDLKKKGGNLITPPEGFFVTSSKGPLRDGELERAANWAKKLDNPA